MKTTKEKEDWLISKGWKQWGPDYWIHPVIMSGANWDWCGVDLDGAVNVQKKTRRKTIRHTFGRYFGAGSKKTR